jgi:hypothetical protein
MALILALDYNSYYSTSMTPSSLWSIHTLWRNIFSAELMIYQIIWRQHIPFIMNHRSHENLKFYTGYESAHKIVLIRVCPVGS